MKGKIIFKQRYNTIEREKYKENNAVNKKNDNIYSYIQFFLYFYS